MVDRVKMDMNKIAFIICCNDEPALEECLLYINALRIPEQFQTEILVIREADSMTSAYNAAMRQSDAKYKIYLHQDVLLLKEDFLCDVLNIFKNETIGMIGTVGTKKIPRDAQAARAWNYGNVLVYNGNEMIHMKYLQDEADNTIEVQAIDGMLMITQYDIEWDEKEFDKFHFYDISQCMEFQRKGYKIVVPKDDCVWALHDSGISTEQGYDNYRKCFCKKYQKYGFYYDKNDDSYSTRVWTDLQVKKKKIFECAENGITRELLKLLQDFEESGYTDTDVFILRQYIETQNREIETKTLNNTNKTDWDSFKILEREIKWLLWRVELKNSWEAARILVERLEGGMCTLEMVQIIVEHAVRNRTKVWKVLTEVMQK